MGGYFVFELKIVSVAYHNWVFLFLCEFKIISTRVSVADRPAPSYRSCFVAVRMYVSSF